MIISRNRWGLGALSIAVALLLAACAQPDTRAGLPNSVTVDLSLASNAVDAQALTPQGSPYDPTNGNLALETVRVSVYSAGELVTFETSGGDYVAREGAATEFITLTATGAAGGVSSATVNLPGEGNPYTFVAHGYADVADPVIAYSSQAQNVSDDSTVWIRPDSVLGAARLVPRLPTKYATPGQVLDLMLEVAANGHSDFGDEYLQVPLGDFEASYVTSSTVVAHSNRGIRLQVATECIDPLSVTADVEGLVQDGNEYVAGSLASAGIEVLCPPRIDGSINADIEAPAVSITSYSSTTGEVVGTASDNIGLAKVQIFDGGVLLASTDESEATGDVSLIAFIGGGDTFRTTLGVAPYGGIIAVAFDTSGHEGRSEELASPNFVWVDAGAVGPGTGSEADPFTSIQAAIDAVNVGGTVYIAGGSYVEQLILAKDITLVGAGDGNTRIISPDVMIPAEGTGAAARFPIVEVVGSGVTAHISGVSVEGPFGTAGGGGSGCTMIGVRVKDAVLHMSDSSVIGARQDPFSGNQCGTGIQVGRSADGDTGTAYLTDVNVSDFQKTGIFVDGVGSTLQMTGGAVTGHGETGVTAQNAVQISRGATATISGVTISDANYGPSNWGAAGLLLWESGRVELDGNIFAGNDMGLGIGAGSVVPVLRNNEFGNTNQDYAIVNYGSEAVDLTQGNTFAGVLPATASDAELFAIEDLIFHGADANGYGFVRVKAGHVFVTGSTGGIQVGVDASTAGDVIVVETGDYRGEGTIVVPASKPYLTLEGNGSTANGFDVQAAGVTVNGFNLEFAHCPAETGWYVSAINGGTASAGDSSLTPLASVQDAVDAAVAGDTVCVAAGTYAVDDSGVGADGATINLVAIDKPLTLVGPNVGVAGNATREAEAVLVVSSSDKDTLRAVWITSGDVTVDGFTMTTETPKQDPFPDGISGVRVGSSATDDVVIRNNRLVNTNFPVWVNRGRTDTPATGYVIENNLIEGSAAASDQGILMQAAHGTISNNVIRDTRVGIQVQPYGQVGTGAVTGNAIEAFQAGLWFNYQEDAAASWTFEGNNVMGIASPWTWPLYTEDPGSWSGIRIETFYEGTVNFTGNTVEIGAANPTHGRYLLRQRGVTGGMVAGIGTADTLGSFFTVNDFPDFGVAGVTPGDLTEEDGLIQLAMP